MTNTKGNSAQKVEIGYALISEEHPPNDLVIFSHLAEEADFSFATISDHSTPG